MSLKRRIRIANLLMVLIPVAATGLVALTCAFAIWRSLSLGNGFDGTNDLREAALAATATADAAFSAPDDTTRTSRLDSLATVLDKTGLALEIREADGEILAFSHGNLQPGDAELRTTAASLGADSLAEHAGRTALLTELETGDTTYELAFYGDIRTSASYPQLKVAIVAAAALTLATVLAAAMTTSRVISRFLVRHFEEELDRASAELVRKNLQLEQRDAARRQLVADISHDLRSPLTSIRGYAEGLIDGVAATPERQRHYLEVIRDKSVQVSELAENVFSFSKLELDDYPVRLEPSALDEAVRDVAERVAADHPGQLEATFALGAVSALADRDLLSRSLANVLENSVKYRRGSAAHVRISAAEAGGRIVLDIADDGTGVSPDVADRLFEPFYRTDAARERPQDGSGLGLAFVRRAMELMGGTASARVNEPHGLVIRLTLPTAHAGTSIAAQAGAAHDAPAPATLTHHTPAQPKE